MIKKLLLCLLFIGSAQAEPFDGWTDEEKTWFVASEVAQVMDYQTTRDMLFVQKSKDYYEQNLLVGRHPSPNKLMAFEIGTLVGNYFFTDWLDHDMRLNWLKMHVGIELVVIRHNLLIGARLNF